MCPRVTVSSHAPELVTRAFTRAPRLDTLAGDAMMLILLYYLLSQTHAEWVEIAQNNYRRNTLRKDSDKIRFFTTESYKKYPNFTMRASDKNNGIVNRVRNVGNVRRAPVAAGTKPALEYESTYRPKYETIDSMETGADVVSNKQESYDIDLGDSKKVIKFAADNLESNRHDTPAGNRNGLSPIVMDDNVYSVRNKGKYLTTDPTSIKNQTEIPYSQKPNLYSTLDSKVHFNDLYTETSTNFMIETNINAKRGNNDYKFPQDELKTVHGPLQNNRKSLSKKPKISSSSIDSYPNIYTTIEELPPKYSDVDCENTSTSIMPELGAPLSSQRPEVSKLNLETIEKGIFAGMWRMLMSIKEIISRNTKSSVKSKIKYLEDLKHNILNSIEDHVNRAWPDDSPAQEHSRATRSAHARGYVELPSSEGALMTISFLTFAVFLIKLVLQIIHTYKNKTMMVTPAVVTAFGRAVAGARRKN